MTLQDFNNYDESKAKSTLFQCCGSSKWTNFLMEHFPFDSEERLLDLANHIWYEECSKEDWLESFTHHPQIGDIKTLQEKYSNTQHIAAKEQSGIQEAKIETLEQLAHLNKEYKNKNGFIFIVCATGKSADGILRLLQDRIRNEGEEEMHIAMGEQAKITIIRLRKMIQNANWDNSYKSQLSAHVLDTSIGKPGQNITIKLQELKNTFWKTISQGVTDEDGRVSDLLPPRKKLKQKGYKLVFETLAYYNDIKVKGFYPEVGIQFTVLDNNHYHIPLLINPYGYTTYRGS